MTEYKLCVYLLSSFLEHLTSSVFVGLGLSGLSCRVWRDGSLVHSVRCGIQNEDSVSRLQTRRFLANPLGPL